MCCPTLFYLFQSSIGFELECQSRGKKFWELWWSPGNFVIRTGCYVAHLFPTCNRCIVLSPPTYIPTPQNHLLPFWLWLCGMPEFKLSYNIGTTISFNFDRETVHAAKRNFQCQGIPVIMITLVPQMSFASGWERPKSGLLPNQKFLNHTCKYFSISIKIAV